MTTQLKRISTKDATGAPNGWLSPLEYDADGGTVAYITAVAPGCVKGPHLHHIREGNFTCIKGTVAIVTRENGAYHTEVCGDSDLKRITVPPGVPCALYNIGFGEAQLLNHPHPPYRADQNDEHTVDDWNYAPEPHDSSLDFSDPEVIRMAMSGLRADS